MGQSQAITWPSRNRRRVRRVNRQRLQFRAAPDDVDRLDDILRDLSVIAPDANLTITDILVAALSSYLDSLEGVLGTMTQENLRVQLYEARDLVAARRTKKLEQEPLAKNI